MPTTSLSKTRRISWYASSATFTLFLVWFISEKGLLNDPDTAKFEVGVFILVWALVIGLLRLVCRDMKDPSES
jgi:hypothetical protein